MRVDLLVGNDGLFERVRTPVRAGPDYPMQVDGDIGPAERHDLAARYGGVTDWNGDGVREIFAIAFSTGTSPTRHTFLSVFDTRTRNLRQLKIAQSRTTDTPNFVGNPEPGLRAWLGQRLREFVGSHELEGCSRNLGGELQCRGRVASDAVEEAAARTGILLTQLQDAWIVEHGRDFTAGRLRLQFRPGRINAPEAICFDDGRYRWLNLFKGPLAITDRNANRSALVYSQDGDHHREIPVIIRGRTYVWLGLAADRHLLAIDPRTWRVERIEVAEWHAGIPDPYEPGRMLDPRATKDEQLYSLEVSGGRLVYSGQPLTLRLGERPIDQAHEFAAARGCNHMGRWGPGNS